MPMHRHLHHENSHHRDNLNLHHRDNLNLPKTNTNPRKLFLFLLKCIIMACIVSLFLLFLGFAALVLLHFLFITTAFRRHRRHRNRRTGSSDRIVDRINLPEVIYHPVSSQLETRDCAICLEGFREGESCRSLPPCGHFFHMVCVDSWLMKVPTCPVCRTRVRLSDQENSLVMSDDDWKIWWAVSS